MHFKRLSFMVCKFYLKDNNIKFFVFFFGGGGVEILIFKTDVIIRYKDILYNMGSIASIL